uniref:Uncharacterized protein n=1 Tax=Romanomermis culicivorax TaxID=13658 RepID=A0A915IK88_ROMCU
MVPPHARVSTNEHYLISPSPNKVHVPPPIAIPCLVSITNPAVQRLNLSYNQLPSSTQNTRLKASSLMMTSA